MEHFPLDVLYEATVLLLISGGKKDKEPLQSEHKTLIYMTLILKSYTRDLVEQWNEDSVIATNLCETAILTLTWRLSDISLLALLLSSSDLLSDRTSIDGLLEFSWTNVLHSV